MYSPMPVAALLAAFGLITMGGLAEAQETGRRGWFSAQAMGFPSGEGTRSPWGGQVTGGAVLTDVVGVGGIISGVQRGDQGRVTLAPIIKIFIPDTQVSLRGGVGYVTGENDLSDASGWGLVLGASVELPSTSSFALSVGGQYMRQDTGRLVESQFVVTLGFLIRG